MIKGESDICFVENLHICNLNNSEEVKTYLKCIRPTKSLKLEFPNQFDSIETNRVMNYLEDLKKSTALTEHFFADTLELVVSVPQASIC